MKFDFVIGNPPYQETLEGTSDKPIYNQFMDEAFRLSDKVELITPARFLFNAGKTPKDWMKKMLNDEHFKVMYYEQDSSKVFANTDIKGGVAITYRDSNKNFGAIEMFTDFEELNSILKKVKNRTDFKSINKIIYLQNKFDLNALYEDYPELKSEIGSGGKEKRLTTSIFNIGQIFFDKEIPDSYKVLGLKQNNRLYKYICKKYLTDNGNTNKYKVIIPKSNGSGAIGEVLSTPIIGTPIIGYTQSFIGVGSFETKEEAEACIKYIKSKFARVMLGILKITQDNPPEKWAYVPLQDFAPDSDIDWSVSVADIDKQLYKKYGLSPEEIEFIETHVKEMV